MRGEWLQTIGTTLAQRAVFWRRTQSTGCRSLLPTWFQMADDFSKQLSDSCQIFYIRQKNSYSRLFITRNQFEELLYAYSMFPLIWDFILPFGFKTYESDIGHAPFRFRRLGPLSLPDGKPGSFGKSKLYYPFWTTTNLIAECAYGFRYVKLNGRSRMMKDNPDYDPWSIRQTAVYQQYNCTGCKVVLILIASSDEAEANLEEQMIQLKVDSKRLNPFQLHLILIATLRENWRLYIRSLEHALTKQVSDSSPICVNTIESFNNQSSQIV